MRDLRWSFLVLLLILVGVSNPPGAAGRAKQAGAGHEEPPKKEEPERAIAGMVRQMQVDLEGASSRGFLGHIDAAQFDDYPQFEDRIERLTRENTLRVYFRQASSSIQQNSAQTILDAEMEMTRKDSAAPVERRRQQVVIDFERTSRGWKIINITPREFFRPL